MSTLTRTASAPMASVTVVSTGPACFITLVRASCRIRYSARPCSSGTMSGDPVKVQSMVRPAPRASSTRPSISSSPGGGSRSADSSSRRMPRILSSSPSARLPLVSMSLNARRANSGSSSNTCPAAPACKVAAVMVCPTASWSSRASRFRSSRTAVRRCSCRARCRAVGFNSFSAPRACTHAQPLTT